MFVSFWGHVQRRPNIDESMSWGSLIDILTEPKVSNSYGKILFDEDVGGLQVSVQYPQGVDIVDSACDLSQDIECLALLYCP